MSIVRRIFVEKREGFDIEARRLLADLEEDLGFAELTDLRLFNRYDIEGLSEQDFDRAARTILSQANVDELYSSLPSELGQNVFAVEYLPGQYDRHADSTAQCIALQTLGQRPKVLSAKVYAIFGSVSDAQLEKIKDYLINPVETRLASMGTYDSLHIKTTEPEAVPIMEGFAAMSDAETAIYHERSGFAMSLADISFVRDYFRDEEGRDPTETELRVIDTYWSDHCRHTTFLTELTSVEVEQGELSKAIENAWQAYLAVRKTVYGQRNKDITLMDMATIGTKMLKMKGLANDLDESEEINACSIEAEVTIDGEKQPWLIQFKNETHNHPTEIEPFGGAGTCLGGAIRDPLSGRAYVYQAMRVSGSGDPNTPFEKTLQGKLPQKKITVGAAQGYSSYGNQIGLTTGQVTEFYDEGYLAKRMELGAVIAASPKENVRREVPAPGDLIILLGGRTGRDGCGGATGSSKAHDTESIESCGAEVQKGDPTTERKLQRLFRKKAVTQLIKRCNDFGAGGISVAVGELADGLDIRLDAILTKYEGIGGTELAISESQERMAVVVAAADAEHLIALAQEENLEATVVAQVTENPRLVMHWRGDAIVNVSRAFLNTNGVTQKAKAKISAVVTEENYRLSVPKILKNISGAAALKTNLARLEVCSQKGLVERFDASIGAGTVLMPLAGKTQLTPEEAMCAKIPLESGQTDDASAMSFGFIPGISRWSPFHGAAYAVTEALAKLAAIGANPLKARLSLQEYFESLRDVPERWGKPAAALLGALAAQLNFGVPAIGGKDSMSGSFNELDVPPTLVCFAIAMTKAGKIGSAAFKKAGSKVRLLPLPVDEETLLPDWERAKQLFEKVAAMVAEGSIRAASVVREGGAAAAVCRMAFGNSFGFDFADNLDQTTLFAPLSGSFVVETAEDARVADFECIELGQTTANDYFKINGDKITSKELVNAWQSTLEGVFPTKAKASTMPFDIPLDTKRHGKSAAIKKASPRVIIPVFPQTSSELDFARAFKNAGAQPEILVMKNLSPQDIDQSISAFVESINAAQIIMLPDGSANFIAIALRNEKVREAVQKLLENRDGLMLGIGDGFQALIKTGLLSFGSITDKAPLSPTLTLNPIGRHVSQMVYTRITSVKSPWLSLVEAGDVHAVAVSHEEGRFVADDDTLKQLIENGQIATQYVDLSGTPCSARPFNPNGSVGAVEGITSPDGRILGKMAHSERKGDNLYKNIAFDKDQKIFESGVLYFK